MGERAYAYAKTCGIIGKSFIGKRMNRLMSVSRLSELDRLVFPDSSRDLPEKELLVDLEDRLIERAVDSIISVVRGFSKPPELLTLLLRSYEYADLKSALVASMEGDKKLPAHADLGPFQTVRFNAWPDIEAMIKGTSFEFLLDKTGDSPGRLNQDSGISLQTALDRHYYNALWKSLFALPLNDRQTAKKILAEEISLRNSGWVLRLRVYYGMTADAVRHHLIDIPVTGKKSGHTLADEAIQCLSFPLDHYEAWNSWRWKGFLNSDSRDMHWKADPRHFQNAASMHLYRLARHHFRLRPFSLDTVFCFIKLKQFEEDVLTSCSEGLGMSMPTGDIVSLLGVEP